MSDVAIIVCGSRILVSASWLRTCGMQRFEGRAFEVVRVRDFGFRGVMFDVTDPDGGSWTVWDVRGVELAPEPALEPDALRVHVRERLAMIPQPVQQQQARASSRQTVEAAAFPSVQETADDRDAVNIANAAHFTVSIRRDGAMGTIRDISTLAEAGASALLLERESGKAHLGLVYAVTAEGRSALVPRRVWEPAVLAAIRALPPQD